MAMLKWRLVAGFFAIVLMVLAPSNILGFHEPSHTDETVLLVGVALIWCICDAVDRIAARLEKDNG